jgi:2-methylaconitate cis-trans-isomerase PrpF
VRAAEIDVLVRAMSMGKLHHAMMGTASVAIAAAAAVPGTLVARAASGTAAGRSGAANGATADADPGGANAGNVAGRGRDSIRFGHPSGVLRVGAQAERTAAGWRITKAVMSRSARVLMDGWVHVPRDSF